jgi:hypothetical protein
VLVVTYSRTLIDRPDSPSQVSERRSVSASEAAQQGLWVAHVEGLNGLLGANHPSRRLFDPNGCTSTRCLIREQQKEEAGQSRLP